MTRNEVDRRVFTSSIDFKVELQLVAFVQFTQTRALHGTDVHERIRLTIIASDEAEALHRVEELHRTGGLFAGQFALRGCRARFNRDDIAYNLQIGCGNLAATINQIEFELLAFRQTFKTSPFNSADMDEDVFAAIFALDEAEALLAVEELYGAFAGSDNLGRHAAAARTAAEAATAAARTTAEAATVTAAEAAAITETTPTTAEAVIAAETAVGIEIVFAETVPLVASASPPPSVKTHINQ